IPVGHSRTYATPQTPQQHTPQSPQDVPPMPSTYLLWSVLALVLCCMIPGIVAVIFSAQVSSRYYRGDIEGSRRASRMAEIWIIVSFVLGVLSATLYLPMMLIK
ncbi:MAG: CD225/dispanin family protein, partial [Muribaculaceae bacterium]|nr:CD225/dispanin family protein [Muribaculaceae bacterium]